MGKIKESYRCSLGLTIDLIGGKWKLMILWFLISGSKRFGEIKKHIPEITHKILTEQLRELEETSIVSRHVYATVPPKVEYSLTNYGESLTPIILNLCDWTKKYADENNIKL